MNLFFSYKQLNEIIIKKQSKDNEYILIFKNFIEEIENRVYMFLGINKKTILKSPDKTIDGKPIFFLTFITPPVNGEIKEHTNLLYNDLCFDEAGNRYFDCFFNLIFNYNDRDTHQKTGLTIKLFYRFSLSDKYERRLQPGVIRNDNIELEPGYTQENWDYLSDFFEKIAEDYTVRVAKSIDFHFDQPFPY